MRLIYTATRRPVAIGDRHTVQGFDIVVASAPRPHKADSEGRIGFNMADGTRGPDYYCGVIDAAWIERGDRGWIDAPAAYNAPGHECPPTGRLAMTIADAYARPDAADRTFWLYRRDAAEMGMEPWRLIDGLDATTAAGADGRPAAYTIDFDSGRTQDGVAPDCVIYMQRTKAERQEGL